MLAKRSLVVGFLLLAPVALAHASAANLSKMDKEVSFRQMGQGEWKKAKANEPLAIGDMVRTGSGARAEITYASGSVVRLAESTTLALTQPEDKGWGRLLLGKLWIKATKGRNARVITPTATAAVQGTEFLLHVDEEQNTKIIVFAGSVKFTGSLGDAVTVKGGQWGLAKPETKLDPPQPAPLDEVLKAEPWIRAGF